MDAYTYAAIVTGPFIPSRVKRAKTARADCGAYIANTPKSRSPGTDALFSASARSIGKRLELDCKFS